MYVFYFIKIFCLKTPEFFYRLIIFLLYISLDSYISYKFYGVVCALGSYLDCGIKLLKRLIMMQFISFPNIIEKVYELSVFVRRVVCRLMGKNNFQRLSILKK